MRTDFSALINTDISVDLRALRASVVRNFGIWDLGFEVSVLCGQTLPACYSSFSEEELRTLQSLRLP